MNYDDLLAAHPRAPADAGGPRVIGWVAYASVWQVEGGENDLGGWGGWVADGHRWPDYLEDLDPAKQPYFEALRADILARKIRRGGDWHQTDPEGVPVFSDGRIVTLTYRAWGDLMAAIWATEDGRDYHYMNFYMDGLEPEPPPA